MRNPVIMHVNYAEQGQSLEQACRLAVDLGYDGIEFRNRSRENDEGPAAYLNELAHAVEHSGLRQVIFGGPGLDLANPDPSVRDNEVERICRFYELAAERFDLDVCNILAGNVTAPGAAPGQWERMGSGAVTDEQWDWIVGGLRRVADAAAGIRLAFETHMVLVHDLASAANRLCAAIERPNVGILLDYGNIILHPKGGTLEAAIDACGDRLWDVHLKNLWLMPGHDRLNWMMCSLQDGVIDHREFLRLLHARNYTGPITLEAPRQGDRTFFARQDVDYIRNLMADLEITEN